MVLGPEVVRKLEVRFPVRARVGVFGTGAVLPEDHQGRRSTDSTSPDQPAPLESTERLGDRAPGGRVFDSCPEIERADPDVRVVGAVPAIAAAAGCCPEQEVGLHAAGVLGLDQAGERTWGRVLPAADLNERVPDGNGVSFGGLQQVHDGVLLRQGCRRRHA